MEKDFVPYEQALALKELGFDEPCFGYYTSPDSLTLEQPDGRNGQWVYFAPTFSQAFRWFRDKYNLMIPIYKDDIGQYYFSIPNSDRLLDTTNYCSESYEEAELECLKKLIEIVKEK